MTVLKWFLNKLFKNHQTAEFHLAVVWSCDADVRFQYGGIYIVGLQVIVCNRSQSDNNGSFVMLEDKPARICMHSIDPSIATRL